MSTPDKMGSDAFVALRDAMRRSKVAAIARTVLFRRMRTVLIRPHGKGLVATTLNYDYEVRSSKKAFEDMPKINIEGEMLDLAKHIIGTKKGEFDPASFDDRYEAALANLVKAKIEGKALPKPKKVEVSKPNDPWPHSAKVPDWRASPQKHRGAQPPTPTRAKAGNVPLAVLHRNPPRTPPRNAEQAEEADQWHRALTGKAT
ncbi:Ku protein [Rhizobium sp. BK376]|nr:Ku protein [Rhizobium sp. BK376]